MFSGSKIPKPIITYPLDFTWIITKISNECVKKKSLCPTEMSWIELTIFFQPERNIK